jgi:hypothetical protein
MCWDLQHVLHFSAYEYFQWERVGARWQRRRPWSEFLGFFDRLMNIEGTATNEAVLLDPVTVEWMAEQPEERNVKPRIFGHTKEVNLMMMAVEVASGQPMKRPVIPGFELRTDRKIAKTKDRVSAALDRARARAKSA